jgi:hypothetical protein
VTGKDTKKQQHNDNGLSRLKKIEQRSIPTKNYFNALASEVADEMEVSSQDLPQIQRPPPKPKLVPVLPPDGK